MQIRTRVAVLALGAALALQQTAVGAQTFVYTIFESYLQQLQVGTGIPGMSAAIVQDGHIVWSAGFGERNVENKLPATPDTPFAIGDLTQTVTAGLLLHCRERGELRLDDPIGQWVPNAEVPSTTLRQLITHSALGTPTGYRYSPSRFALLAHPIQACMDEPFRKVVSRSVFNLLGMQDAIPAFDMSVKTAELLQQFDESELDEYAALLRRAATPYKIDRRGRPVESQLTFTGLDGSIGIFASARDLANFDRGLSLQLRPESLALAWTNTINNGIASPFGMGWFVQSYQGEKLVWHFGHIPDGFSSLILKVPGRRLTLILLANSDGLSAPFSFSEGDVTSSHFARTFLRLFL